ncbi:MAG: DUF433 domain-containing protein [Planctomycetota bacterium]
MASETTRTEYVHVVRTPGIVGGEPRIAEHRIRVRDVVAARDLGGLTPEEIAATVYPDLTLAQVYAALAYYEDHRKEIDRLQEAETQFAEKWLKRHPELARDVRPDES